MTEQQNLAQRLDLLLWLDLPIFARMPRETLLLYHGAAAEYGRSLARRYPHTPGHIVEDMLGLGVSKVVDFTPAEKETLTDRAYYEPQTKEVHWNSNFSLDLLSKCGDGPLPCSAGEIDQAILLHEAFHHIEESLETPADAMLQKRYSRFFAPVFREISAFAFVNEQAQNGPCQLVDLLWLKVNAQNRYEYLRERLGKDVFE